MATGKNLSLFPHLETDVRVSNGHVDNDLARTRAEFEATLSEMSGQAVHVHWVSPDKVKKMAYLAHEFKYALLLWDQMAPEAQQRLAAFRPTRPDGIVRLGDLVCMISSPEAHAERTRFRLEEQAKKAKAFHDETSAATLTRELGIKVEADPKW